MLHFEIIFFPFLLATAIEGKVGYKSLKYSPLKIIARSTTRSPKLAFTPPSFKIPLFTETPKVVPSKVEGTTISLPNFEELFGRIQTVSPLARHLIKGYDGGMEAMDSEDIFEWKIIDRNKKGVRIDKIDNFQDKNVPILRFRTSIEGPCIPERFATLVMDCDARKKWDISIAQVYEAYPIYDLDKANIMLGPTLGDCSRLGVGYCQTKQSVVSPREQLTLCGIQDFKNGGSIIWGTEMEDSENHLFPPGKRHVRARTHIFSITLTPTGPQSFDVEYVLQLAIGGNIPGFMHAPVVTKAVSEMFVYAKKYFAGGEDSELAKYIIAKKSLQNVLQNRESILLPH